MLTVLQSEIFQLPSFCTGSIYILFWSWISHSFWNFRAVYIDPSYWGGTHPSPPGRYMIISTCSQVFYSILLPSLPPSSCFKKLTRCPLGYFSWLLAIVLTIKRLYFFFPFTCSVLLPLIPRPVSSHHYSWSFSFLSHHFSNCLWFPHHIEASLMHKLSISTSCTVRGSF